MFNDGDCAGIYIDKFLVDYFGAGFVNGVLTQMSAVSTVTVDVILNEATSFGYGLNAGAVEYQYKKGLISAEERTGMIEYSKDAWSTISDVTSLIMGVKESTSSLVKNSKKIDDALLLLKKNVIGKNWNRINHKLRTPLSRMMQSNKEMLIAFIELDSTLSDAEESNLKLKVSQGIDDIIFALNQSASQPDNIPSVSSAVATNSSFNASLAPQLNQMAYFRVTGANLPSTLVMTVADCENTTAVTRTSTYADFQCVPRGTGGYKGLTAYAPT